MNETQIYTLAAAAILCLAGVIAFLVQTALHWWRRRRTARQMERPLSSREAARASTEAGRRMDRFSDKQNEGQEALGWPAEEIAGASTGAENSSDAKHGAAPGRGKTILIADDDPVVTFALSRRLQQLGYTAIRSPDAVHALVGAMKIAPDLVILDVNMPSGNGLAVCEMMASDPRYAGIPVIIHSVIADEATKQRCERLGAHHVAKSSTSWAQIRALVERFFGPSKAAEPQPPTDDAPVDDWGAVASHTAAAPPASEPSASVAAAENAEESVPASSAAPSAAITGPTPSVCGRSRVLCIEAPKDRLELVEHQLSGLAIDVVRTNDLDEGFWTCFTEKPHVVIIHAAGTHKKLPGLLNKLATHPVTRNLPVLWINEGNAAAAADALPVMPSLKVLKYPIDWEDLLDALADYIPAFGRDDNDPLARMPGHDASKMDARARAPADDRHTPPGAEGRPLTILCIDDDPLVARSVAMRLQPYGIRVKEADNGTGGYMLAAAEPPDLILLDLKMPSGEGNYILGKLKDNVHTKDIPVIILTVETAMSAQRQMLSLGAEAFISKPVHWHDLFAEIGRHVQLPNKLLADYNIPDLMVTVQ